MPAAVGIHVPAWKKLGLKLKNAPEELETSGEIPQHTSASQKKRKPEFQENTADVDHLHEKPAKRPRKSRDEAQSTAGALNGSVSPATKPAKPTLTRKSVSFTPETKTQDGDSTKDLYNSWIASQKASDSSFDPSAYGRSALKSIAAPEVKPIAADSTKSTSHIPSKDAESPNPQKQKKKKKKKRNKSKSTALSSTSSIATKPVPTSTSPSPLAFNSTSTPHPALIYLTTHHTSPETWKFSKSRSTYLLRHCFSPTHIPPSYDDPLKSYLRGLQSSGARQRLVDQALKIRREDEEWLSKPSPVERESKEEREKTGEQTKEGWRGIHHSSLIEDGEGSDIMDDPAKRKELFLRAVEEHKSLLHAREDAREEAEKDAIWRAKVERRRRAEMVLGIFEDLVQKPEGGLGERDRVLTNGVQVNGSSNRNGVMWQKKPLPNGGEKVKGKRKRKRRTTGVRDDESSSSSSSSSSESEDNSDNGASRKRIEINGTIATTNGHSKENAVDLTEETSSEGTSDSATSSSGTSESESESGSD